MESVDSVYVVHTSSISKTKIVLDFLLGDEGDSDLIIVKMTSDNIESRKLFSGKQILSNGGK